MDPDRFESSVERLVPQEELGDLAAIPEKRRFEIVIRLSWIDRLLAAPHGCICEVREEAARALGVSTGTVSRYLANYRRRGWRGLIDGRDHRSRRIL